MHEGMEESNGLRYGDDAWLSPRLQETRQLHNGATIRDMPEVSRHLDRAKRKRDHNNERDESQMPIRTLGPIKEDPSDFERLEVAIRDLLKVEIYLPLMKELGAPVNRLTNSTDDLIDAIRSGKIYFDRGQFRGRFNAATSRELKRIGAKWDRQQGSFKIPLGSLSIEIKTAVQTAEHNLSKTFERINSKLREILPEKISDKLKIEKLFDTTLLKIDHEVTKSLRGMVVTPELSRDQRAKIAEDYTKNMRLYVKDFTEKEIVRLRKQIEKNAVSGKRYENLVKDIQESYNVTQNKAKFLARQETSLLMTKFKEIRYTDAGVKEYIWGCVAGSKNHPVRPWHKALEGKTFSWNHPPVTTKPGEPVRRNNPGQDYNCRCFARPVVKF